MGCHALLQGIFPTQGSNPGLPQYRQILNHVSHQGNPRILEWVAYPFYRGNFWPRNQTGSSLPAELPWKPHLLIYLCIYWKLWLHIHITNSNPSIEFIYFFLYLHLSSAQTTRLHYHFFFFFSPLSLLYLLLWSTLLYSYKLPSLLCQRLSLPHADILCWAAFPHRHPSQPCLSAPPGTSSLCSLCKSFVSSRTVCVLHSPCWTPTPALGHQGSFLFWCTSHLVLPHLKVLGGKRREAEEEGEEEEELYVLLNNEKPLTLTSPNNHWVILKSSIDLKTCYIVGLPGHLLPLLSPGCQALLCMS